MMKRQLQVKSTGYYRQRVIRRSFRYSVLPGWGLLFLLLLLGWEIIKENMIDGSARNFPFNITLLGVGITANLTGGLAALLLARGQFARSIRPTIGYNVRPRSGEILAGGDLTVWLFNGGPGMSVVYSMEFRIQISPELGTPWISYPSLLENLESIGLMEGQQFKLTRFGPGAPLPPVKHGEEGSELLSITGDFLRRITVFDIRIRVIDVVGDMHERILGCISAVDQRLISELSERQ